MGDPKRTTIFGSLFFKNYFLALRETAIRPATANPTSANEPGSGTAFRAGAAMAEPAATNRPKATAPANFKVDFIITPAKVD